MDLFPPPSASAQNNYLLDSLALTKNGILSTHSIPYLIIALNYIIFKLLRSFVNKIIAHYQIVDSSSSSSSSLNSNNNNINKNKHKTVQVSEGRKLKLLKLFSDELISTCELCANCAELNVVYEKHGSLAYGLSLFILTYLWMDAFGEAHTTPGYLVEDYFLVDGSQTLKTGSTYARFIGQSLAMPLAWRFASFYWGYKLLNEHQEMLIADNCKSALSTSTLNGFLIEFICCMLCRLIELFGHRMLENKRLTSQRLVSICSSFICTSLVVMALELSGGYFNPILATSLEFGCKGIHFYQHALVFWLGPLLGHVIARGLFKWLAGGLATTQTAAASHTVQHQKSTTGRKQEQVKRSAAAAADGAKRMTRSGSQRKKHLD